MNRIHYLLLVALYLLGTPIHAVEYNLVKGEQFELCRAYEQSLNNFSRIPPMACERQFDVRAEEFWQPKWEALNPAEHLDLIRQTLVVKYSFRPSEDIEARWNRWREKLKDKIQSGEVELSRTRVDINHDGEKETIYRFADRTCDPTKELDRRIPSTYRYYVDEQGAGNLSPAYADLQRGSKNLFFYRGRGYVDRFDDVTSATARYPYDAKLYVFELGDVKGIRKLFVQQVCDLTVQYDKTTSP